MSQPSTPCFDLAEFDSVPGLPCPVVPVVPVDSVTVNVVDRRVVASPELDAAVMDLDMSMITSWFSPLNPPGSPVSMVSVDQVIFE